MFTGLVEAMGRVTALEHRAGGLRLAIDARPIAEGIHIGDSICISGCCLTVVHATDSQLEFDVVPETLRCTTLGTLEVGSFVNLERSLAVGDRLGGHFVTGHVDCVGLLAKREDASEWSTFTFAAPLDLVRQMANKGSIAVDGVSLTLVTVGKAGFSVALIPHTLEVTTLGRLQVGSSVNLETDILAKYVERQLQASRKS